MTTCFLDIVSMLENRRLDIGGVRNKSVGGLCLRSALESVCACSFTVTISCVSNAWDVFLVATSYVWR